MDEVNFGILKDFVEFLVSFGDAKSIADQVQISFISTTNGENICVWMALVDGDKLGAETETDHGNIDLLLRHYDGRKGGRNEIGRFFAMISVAIPGRICHDKLRKKDEVFHISQFS